MTPAGSAVSRATCISVLRALLDRERRVHRLHRCRRTAKPSADLKPVAPVPPLHLVQVVDGTGTTSLSHPCSGILGIRVVGVGRLPDLHAIVSPIAVSFGLSPSSRSGVEITRRGHAP